MTLALRPYQHLARVDLYRAWARGERVILAMPTGAGKTVVMHSIADRELGDGARVLWLTHLDLLVEQSVKEAVRFGHEASVLRSDDPRYDPTAKLQVASVQTLIRRKVPWVPDVIITDECHHCLAKTWMTLLGRWPAAKIAGCTATPWRADGKGLGAVADRILSPTTPDRLVADGHLVPPRILAPPLVRADRLRVRAGEYIASEVEAAVKPGLGDVARHLVEAIDRGHAPALAFCATLAHSVALRDELRRRGVRAEDVHAGTDTEARDELLGPGGALASGYVQAVCSVGVLDEGVDCPDVRCIALASPTASSARFLQRVGRGLRPAPGKTECLVIDCGQHTERFWHPLEDLSHYYSLQGAPDRKTVQAASALSPRTCPECFAVYTRAAWPAGPCPSCGVEPRQKAVKVEEKGVGLREVERATIVPWSDKWDKWREICAIAVERGYKDGWAAMQYKAWSGGFWPSKAQQGELKRARGDVVPHGRPT